MTGRDDAAAAEQAELETLRRRADERRKELGDTLDALTAKLAADTDMRRWAQRATAGLGRATVAAAWRALPGNGSASGTAGALQRAGGTAAGALQRAGRDHRGRAAVIAGSAGLVLAGAAWWLLVRQRRRWPSQRHR